MTSQTFWRAILPISALFAGTLWLGNAAYLYLSVAFIQMLKVLLWLLQGVLHTVRHIYLMYAPTQALMPVSVFVVGCSLGTESFQTSTLVNMIVVCCACIVSTQHVCVHPHHTHCLHLSNPSRFLQAWPSVPMVSSISLLLAYFCSSPQLPLSQCACVSPKSCCRIRDSSSPPSLCFITWPPAASSFSSFLSHSLRVQRYAYCQGVC